MIPLVIASCFCGALLLSAGLNWLALIPWRRSIGKHWTERARQLYPARRSAGINVFLIPVGFFATSFVLAPGMNPLVAAVPAFFGSLLGGHFTSREISRQITFTQWLRYLITIALLNFGSAFLILFAGLQMPEDFGLFTWLFGASILAIVIAFQFGLNAWILELLRFLRPGPEHLSILVKEVSQKMEVPVRGTWVADIAVSNAMALPASRQLIFTGKLLATHPDDEIKAICAHELSHLSEPKKVLLTRMAAVAALFPLILIRPFASIQALGPNGFWVLVLPFMIFCVVKLRLGRKMEKRADRIAIENQPDPAVYARALERLYRTNQMPAVMPPRMATSHPDLYDRMLAAGVTPDFPKPAPPTKHIWTTFVVLLGVVSVPVFAFVFQHFLPPFLNIFGGLNSFRRLP